MLQSVAFSSGTGKSHLLIGLGAAAATVGYRVRYVLAAELVNELVEAADDKQLNKTIARYGRVDLLCIDELGYMELDRRGAELLFQVLTEREEKNRSPSPPMNHFPKRTCSREPVSGDTEAARVRERGSVRVRCVSAEVSEGPG